MIKKNLTIFFVLFLTVFLFTTANAQDNTNKEKPKDRPLKITKHSYPKNVGNLCNQSSTVVRLKVTFDKSEVITNVELVSSSGCETLDNKSIEAAKKIKFRSAIKDGEPVTVTRQIEYDFKIY